MSLRATQRPTDVLRPAAGPTVVLRRGDADVASWPLRLGARPDMGIVDQLARLQLEARRLGCSICLRNVCAELRELIELSGLDLVIGND
jgi:ABC-type transporter Mla MlaB component